MKNALGVFSAPRQHWVGDGFPVRSLFSYGTHRARISPFLLLDYAGPMTFEPATKPRGVGEHPHRGFETVTIVYEGEVAHRDSTGAGGIIGPGDVQWMTAASGVLHDEFHSPAFTSRGGVLEMVQLWVNLPAAAKMTAPKYQTLEKRDIPTVGLANDAGELRVIAGEFNGQRGPAETFTPLDVWDVHLKEGSSVNFEFTAGHTLMLVLLRGHVTVNDENNVHDAQMILLERANSRARVNAGTDSRLLVLSGEPIDEPIAGHGPFVMNTEAEIRQAIADYTNGQFGSLQQARRAAEVADV